MHGVKTEGQGHEGAPARQSGKAAQPKEEQQGVGDVKDQACKVMSLQCRTE
jgi:hypothetical protein